MSEVPPAFVLESLNTATDHKTCQRMAREVGIFLIEHPAAATSADDLVGAYEDSLSNAGSMKRASEDYEMRSYPDTVDAIGTLIADQGSACVLLTKNSTIVVAPTANGQHYVMLDIGTKRVDFTKAPEFDLMNIRDVVDVSLVKAVPLPQEAAPAPVVEAAEPPEKKRKPAAAAATGTKAPRAQKKLVVPIIEVNPPAVAATDDSSEVQIKTATL